MYREFPYDLSFGGLSPSVAELGAPCYKRFMAFLVFHLNTALDFSFLCSIAEAVPLSSTPAQLASVEEKHRSQRKRRSQRRGLNWEGPNGSAEASPSARVQDG